MKKTIRLAMMNKTLIQLTGEEADVVEEVDEQWATKDPDTEKLKLKDVGDNEEEVENKNSLSNNLNNLCSIQRADQFITHIDMQVNQSHRLMQLINHINMDRFQYIQSSHSQQVPHPQCSPTTIDMVHL